VPLLRELEAMYDTGFYVFDSASNERALIRGMLLFASSDYRGVPHLSEVSLFTVAFPPIQPLAQQMQAPALNGACLCCAQPGIKPAGLATIYLGAHRFLPVNHSMRSTWATEHSQHLEGKERKAFRTAAKTDPAPAARTNASIVAAGEAVDDGVQTARESGFHGLSIFSEWLEYWDARLCVTNDPMHIYTNSSTE